MTSRHYDLPPYPNYNLPPSSLHFPCYKSFNWAEGRSCNWETSQPPTGHCSAGSEHVRHLIGSLISHVTVLAGCCRAKKKKEKKSLLEGEMGWRLSLVSQWGRFVLFHLYSMCSCILLPFFHKDLEQQPWWMSSVWACVFVHVCVYVVEQWGGSSKPFVLMLVERQTGWVLGDVHRFSSSCFIKGKMACRGGKWRHKCHRSLKMCFKRQYGGGRRGWWFYRWCSNKADVSRWWRFIKICPRSMSCSFDDVIFSGWFVQISAQGVR